jgi:polyisoprenyl-phosphate glycosyltransferase
MTLSAVEGGDRPSLSVVVPVYGCVGCLQMLCERLLATLPRLTDQFEIVLVDDRSPDESWAAIVGLQARHAEVRGIRLSRNFGQHIAISAGLSVARGDRVVVMDCDLQDPPEVIADMWALMQQGHDIVLARRAQRSHSMFRVLGARLYFYLLGRLNNEQIDGSYGSFSMLSRKVVDAFLRFGERERHYLFILRWLGFGVGTVEYAHQERAAGRSSYSLRRLIHHAIDGVFFQATVFLRLIVGVGLLFGLTGMAASSFFVYRYFAYGAVAGWTSVVVLLLLSTCVILVSLGVVGLYVGKIFDQSKDRPLFVIDTNLGADRTW